MAEWCGQVIDTPIGKFQVIEVLTSRRALAIPNGSAMPTQTWVVELPPPRLVPPSEPG